MFLVVDNEFNRANYPSLIGQRLEVAPSYAHVLDEETEFRKMDDDGIVALWNVETMALRMIGDHTMALRFLGYLDKIMTERGIPHESGKLINKVSTA